jgi:hypothetical protein
VIQILICPSDLLPERVVYLTADATPDWSWGYYGMTSHGGNAGKRSFYPGPPSSYPGLMKDGIFSLDSSIRLADVIDGTSNTFLFGERYHLDPHFDLRTPLYFPTLGPLAGWGKWRSVAVGWPLPKAQSRSSNADRSPSASTL